MKKITIVIPLIKCHVELFNKVCLKSIYTFFDKKSLDKIIIISPSNIINYIKKYIDDYIKLFNCIIFIDENKLYNYNFNFNTGINKYGNYVTKGWKIQQIIKLHVAKYVKTLHYLVLDADCFFTKKCTYDNIIIDNKCIYNVDFKNNYVKWWENSCKYINYKEKQTKYFGVTPSLLYTNICLELIDYLNSQNTSIEIAIDNTATEYTLYWIYILKFKKYSDLYFESNQISLYNNCIWRKEDIKMFNINNYKNNNSYLSVIQSKKEIIEEFTINNRSKLIDLLYNI